MTVSARHEHAHDALCIYCRGTSSCAQSREHVVPHALGNRDWMLPVGMVCDACNNRLGSVVDSPFTSTGIGGMRSLLGVHGKQGATKLTLPKHTKLSVVDRNGARTFRVRSFEGKLSTAPSMTGTPAATVTADPSPPVSGEQRMS